MYTYTHAHMHTYTHTHMHTYLLPLTHSFDDDLVEFLHRQVEQAINRSTSRAQRAAARAPERRYACLCVVYWNMLHLLCVVYV